MKLGTYINFKLPDQRGVLREIKEFLGSKVVIYFYPKDNTPGCTIQAKGYRDLFHEFQQLNTIIIGISKDDVKSHVKFIENQNLPFILLSDQNLEISNKLGFAKEKSLFGNKFFGTVRSSIVLDEIGKVIMINQNTKSNEDALKVLEFIRNYKEEVK